MNAADQMAVERLRRVRYSGPILGNPTDSRHGSDTGYAAGCREECCTRAHSRRRNTERLYPGTWSLVDATGTHRRIRALARLGWSYAEQSRRLNRHRDFVAKVLRNNQLQVETAAMFRALYDELSMTWSTAPTANRTAGWAKANGFAPPLAWDDDIDNPAAVPAVGPRIRAGVDEVLVNRVLGGEWNIPTTQAEKAEIARRWHAAGRTLVDLNRLTGWKIERYFRTSEAAA